jgi:N-acetylglucosamine-6-phosphate deacetylase
MITRIKSQRILQRDGIVSGYVYFENDRILAVTQEELPFDKEVDAGNDYVSPGFIDLHTHGGAGFDFIKGRDEVVHACNFHLQHGTTTIYPTLSAAPFDVMAEAALEIEAAKQDGRLYANVPGAHMEGPYLSPAQCGAQCTSFITPPISADYEPFLEAHASTVARWSYAPENDPEGAFAACLTAHGVLPAAGHTNAVYDDMDTAIKHGCKLVTHLYSCTSTVTRRQGFRYLGVVETALLRDDLYSEIIADGRHLPPDLIRLILKAKGSDRVILITDSLSLAGTNVKQGKMLETEYIIEDGVCKLLDRSAFAGSIATADRLVRVMTGEVEISMAEAVKMITATPAEVMHLNKGELTAGKDADILIFDDDVTIKRIWVMGEDHSSLIG